MSKHTFGMKSLLVLVLAGMLSFALQAQDCDAWYPTEEGTELTYKNYNKRDKLQSTMVQELTSVEKKGDTLVYNVHQKMMDKKDELIYEGDLAFKCVDDKFIIDMRSFMNPEQMDGFKDMEMEITMDEMSLPAKLEPGMELDDGSMKMAMNAGMMTMNFETRITDRKVEAVEEITVPAGSYEAYKISSRTETKTAMMNVDVKSAYWYADEIGMVRSESYDKKGNLQGYTVLTEVN